LPKRWYSIFVPWFQGLILGLIPLRNRKFTKGFSCHWKSLGKGGLGLGFQTGNFYWIFFQGGPFPWLKPVSIFPFQPSG